MVTTEEAGKVNGAYIATELVTTSALIGDP